MTDLNEMVESIRNAVEAVDEAHGAAQELKQNTNHDTFDGFRAKMEELQEHLSKLKVMLDNEEAFAMDELVDMISQVYSGHESEYRKTPRMSDEADRK
jgi:hypothetical protein